MPIDGDMRARLRTVQKIERSSTYRPRATAQPTRQLVQDIQSVPYSRKLDLAPVTEIVTEPQAVQVQPVQLIEPIKVETPEPSYTRSALHQPTSVTAHQPEPSKVLARQSKTPIEKESRSLRQKLLHPRFAKPQLNRSFALNSMAAIVFLMGISASIMGFQTNSAAQAQISNINKKSATSQSSTNSDGDTPPSTKPISASAMAAYTVPADQARYIRIPKLHVNARVLKVGVTKDGALATPSNVFDAAWYSNSAKPGQPGATLIDGHVSSWTTNGVFYGIKNLKAGDSIEIEKGDGTKLEYSVVKTTAYPADNVDMQALMQPVTAGKSGLNLITCGGKYDSKSGEFTERIAVFATLND